GIVRSDHVLGGGGNQDVANLVEAFILIDIFGSGEIGDRSGLITIGDQRIDIEAARVVDGGVVLHDGDNFKSGLAHQARRHSADVAEALNYDSRGGWIESEALPRFEGDD